jgi:hypothetical protein
LGKIKEALLDEKYKLAAAFDEVVTLNILLPIRSNCRSILNGVISLPGGQLWGLVEIGSLVFLQYLLSFLVILLLGDGALIQCLFEVNQLLTGSGLTA